MVAAVEGYCLPPAFGFVPTALVEAPSAQRLNDDSLLRTFSISVSHPPRVFLSTWLRSLSTFVRRSRPTHARCSWARERS